MLRYLETYYRHRRLLALPILLGLAIGAAVFLAQPPSYQSTVKVWFDRTPLTDITGRQNPYVDLSVTESDALTEMLATHSFCTKVGERSGLAGYISAHPAAPSDPVSAITAAVSGRAGQGAVTGARLDDAVFQAIKSGVKVDASGPQLVTITFTHRRPELAQAVAQSISDQFADEMLLSRRSTADTTVEFYSTQVEAQTRVLAAADTRIVEYLSAHPDQRPVTAVPDATLTQLRRTDDLARQRYEDLLQKLDQARLTQAAIGAAGAEGFHTIDFARRPDRPTSRTLLGVEALAGGGLVGLMFALLAIATFTLSETGVQRVDEVRDMLGLRALGAVPRIRSLVRSP